MSSCSTCTCVAIRLYAGGYDLPYDPCGWTPLCRMYTWMVFHRYAAAHDWQDVPAQETIKIVWIARPSFQQENGITFRVNVFKQYVQRWGDSPVCCRTWFSKCSFRVNVFAQKSQRWGVSPVEKRIARVDKVTMRYFDSCLPVCHSMWFVKCSFRLKLLPQISHRNGVSLVWDRIWFAKCSLRVYFLPQTSHWWGVSP